MNNFRSLDSLRFPMPTTDTSSTEQPNGFLDPTLIKALDQTGSLTLVCITIWLCLYSTVQVFSNSVRLTEQINRFIELLVKKN